MNRRAAKRLVTTRKRATLARSIRPYPGLAEVWRMVARSAYVQLRYSPALLARAADPDGVIARGPLVPDAQEGRHPGPSKLSIPAGVPGSIDTRTSRPRSFVSSRWSALPTSS